MFQCVLFVVLLPVLSIPVAVVRKPSPFVNDVTVADAFSGSLPGRHARATKTDYGQHGADWNEGTCQTGTGQSPVDFGPGFNVTVPDPVVAGNADLSVLRTASENTMINYSEDGIVVNGGLKSSVELKLPEAESSLQLDSFHFHVESEHTYNGAHSPAEVHFVFADNDGAPKAVVGFTISEGDTSPLLRTLQQAYVNASGTEGSSTNVVFEWVNGNFFETVGIKGSDASVYTYQGSLTTPACDEPIHWILGNITATNDEIQWLSPLSYGNWRVVQDTTGRTPQTLTLRDTSPPLSSSTESPTAAPAENPTGSPTTSSTAHMSEHSTESPTESSGAHADISAVAIGTAVLAVMVLL
ncbi:carbonic anhydrase [Gregarina niphandrodes]|uniref:carbonic anhydrase n=1 Tax=Gregarina niphandrodes TaxID=110365 RepID=A0A023BBY7_GRENI|nr:carbonic anhydrase [Gregarina niphandrodes]EZG80317.1 carbonic anhydrase [Gregarina niphandrodes]|eukprot:XP_011134303.1 carbonic anhydrase [Gregarina niphandrodes]